MLKPVIEQQRDLTNHFFDALNLEHTEALISILMDCQGVLFFTGVGKSGLVAKKIAFTMISTGTPAMYISPMDALHGDLGMVGSKDIFIMLSKSGESDELLHLVPAIRNKGATLVGVVCNEQSRLSAACHHVITLPFLSELCPFNMAPTMSTLYQSLFGDLLTVELMKRKNFSLDQYALNHPSGRLGKRMTLKVRDLMLTGDRVPKCRENVHIKDVLVELSDKRCGCLLVVDEENKLLGIFTDGDLRRGLQKSGGEVLERRMNEMMVHHPRYVTPTILVWDAMKQMESDYQKRITVFPVLDEEHRVQGLLHLHDILQSGL